MKRSAFVSGVFVSSAMRLIYYDGMATNSLMTDTIFALSSGKLPSGIAVVRISGPGCNAAIQTFGTTLPIPRRAVVRDLLTPERELLDRALVLYFEGPASATGEDCVELHLHGGRAVVSKVLDVLGGVRGLRLAEAGEFTRRAFLNDKMNLVEAESLGDLISAETEAQRRFAVLNSGTLQSQLYAGWRERLLHARAMIEAELDFADEADVPDSVSSSVWADVENLLAEMRHHLNGFRKAEILREGYRVVLVGAPNAGKSSLMNALARRDVAIVSEEAGTTRDVLEVNLDLDGYKVVLLDTAGLRDEATGVEAIGISRTRQQIDLADLVLHLTPVGSERSTIETDAEAKVLAIWSKLDLVSADQQVPLGISVVSGVGLDWLLAEIGLRAKASAVLGEDVVPSRQRHVWLIGAGIGELGQSLDANYPLELRAEALRLAETAIGRVVGRVDVEDLLGAIFSKFCVGK